MTSSCRRSRDARPSGKGAPPRADPSGFAALIRPILGDLVRVARHRLGSDDLAWEAVQEALLGLWMRDSTPENPRAWLLRAVALRSLQIRRAIRRRKAHEGGASSARPESRRGDDPLQVVLVDELRTELHASLARLGPKHRSVLALHLIEGLDYAEIAGRLGVPIGTVRSRLARAREALRSGLTPGLAPHD
jgi:RNA polymerase sigma-70 factor (ECF subfamily)